MVRATFVEYFSNFGVIGDILMKINNLNRGMLSYFIF